MGKLNHNAIDDGYVEVHPSYYSFEYTAEYVPYPYTTPIKSIDDDEMYRLLELFHSEHDDDIFNVGLQMVLD